MEHAISELRKDNHPRTDISVYSDISLLSYENKQIYFVAKKIAPLLYGRIFHRTVMH